jgi:hypothetical protein
VSPSEISQHSLTSRVSGSPALLVRMIIWKSELNYMDLANYQQAREKLEKDLNNSLSICTKIHKAVMILSIKCHLPHISELCQLNSDEHVHIEIEENM